MGLLDNTSTDDLIFELRNRSKTMFLAMRPLADHKEFTAVVAMGVEGRKVVSATDRDSCIGLAYQAMQCAIPKSVD